jgi:hypothetical protein
VIGVIARITLTPFDGARLSIFHSLKTELEPEGISATMITSAPLQPRARQTKGCAV